LLSAEGGRGRRAPRRVKDKEMKLATLLRHFPRARQARFFKPLAIFFAFWASSGLASNPPPSPLLFGVCTHQGIGGPTGGRGYDPALNVQQIRELGLTSFRDDLPWPDFESEDHRFGFAPVLPRLKAQLNAGVARPLLILGGRDPRVPDSDPPATPAALARFGEYVAAAVAATADERPIYEIWNEWNLSERRNPKYDVENYVSVARTAYGEIKRLRPDLPVIVGALGDDPHWAWSRRALAAGLLNYGDGFSVHLYNHCQNPRYRSAAEIVSRLTDLHRLIDTSIGKPDYPLYVTEVGWPTYDGICGVAETRAAENFAQLILWASGLSRWLKGVWIYELKDSGVNRTEIEDNFGIFDYWNKPKAAACAIRESVNFVRAGGDATLSQIAPHIHVVQARTAQGEQAAVWSDDTETEGKVQIAVTGGVARVKHICDETATPIAGATSLTVGTRPIFVSSGLGASIEIEASP
jgi:hypothetical protein